MSHCIKAIVTKRTNAYGLSFRVLPQDFAILIDTPENRKRLKSKDFVAIWTDYFGGAGEQGCTLFTSGSSDCICDKCGTILKSAGEEMDSINAGLKRLGVIRTDSDEFDAIHLGHCRDDEDIDPTMG